MPLMEVVAGAVATWFCLGCGQERRLELSAWRVTNDDESIIQTPPCRTPGCRVMGETFQWSNWVYLSPNPKDLQTPEPDPDHPGAQQMVLIERVARALGRSQARHADRDSRGYPRPPKAPTLDEVRAYSRLLRGERGL